MRKLWTALFTIVLLILFGVAGSWISSRRATPVPIDIPLPTGIENLTGVIEEFSSDATEATLRLPDGGTDAIRLPGGTAVSSADVGLLARVTGTRDAATRIVDAQRFEVWKDAPNLIVTSPETQATTTSPLVVFGFGRVFENQFHWRIKNAKGDVVQEGFATTDAKDAGQFGAFRFEIFLPVLTDPSYLLEVYQPSPKDGKPSDLVSVPLKLLTTESVSFSIFFGNRAKGSNVDCAKVFPVTRTLAKTSAVGRAALLELLLGPTRTEQAQGYFTSLPADAGLNSLSIDNGVATADFDSGLKNVAGSCRVTAIRSQIESTLTQFDTVADVRISIDGDSETALQP